MKNWRNQTGRSGGDKDAGADTDSESRVLSFKQIMKDVTLFGAFTWKERKQMENQKAVELGAKPAKKQRLPLSVARVQMKNQKEREQKLLQEEMALGRFSGKRGGGGARTFGGKRKQENRVLRSTEGFFKNGVLDVKHMMNSGGPSSEGRIPDSTMMDRGRKQKNGGGGGKKHGKAKVKGKGRKKH